MIRDILILHRTMARLDLHNPLHQLDKRQLSLSIKNLTTDINRSSHHMWQITRGKPDLLEGSSQKSPAWMDIWRIRSGEDTSCSLRQLSVEDGIHCLLICTGIENLRTPDSKQTRGAVVVLLTRTWGQYFLVFLPSYHIFMTRIVEWIWINVDISDC